jgi:thiol-disulfide isomerase/thioredoxin
MKAMNSIGIIATVLLFGIMACDEQNKEKPRTTKETKIGLNQIELSDLSGKPVNLEQFNGKTIFINFWATWCKPCIREMPSIQKAMEILKGKNIEFFFASDESIEQIENFKSSNDYDFNYVRLENPVALNIMALPTTYIFNPEGKLVFSEIGVRQWDDKSNIELIMNTNK